MKINCKRRNLGKGELINRAGKTARFFRGNFYCGCQYEYIFENVQHIKFKNSPTCIHPYEPCNNCKVLTNFIKVYYSKI